MSKVRIGETVLGLTVLALGLFIAFETLMTPPLAAKTVVGPGVFPGLVAAGLIGIAIGIFFEAFRGHGEMVSFPQLDWAAIGILVGAFLVTIVTLEWAGWVIAGTFLFCSGAFAFGSRRWLVNAAIGVVLTAVTYFVFDYGLDLELPTGWLVEEVILLLGGKV